MEFAPAEPLDRDQCAAHRFVVAQRIAFQKRFDLDRACVNDIRIGYAVGLECAELICGDHVHHWDDGNIRFPHLVGGIKHRFIGGDDDAYIISTALDGIKVINEIRVEIPRAKQLPPQAFLSGKMHSRPLMPRTQFSMIFYSLMSFSHSACSRAQSTERWKPSSGDTCGFHPSSLSALLMSAQVSAISAIWKGL